MKNKTWKKLLLFILLSFCLVIFWTGKSSCKVEAAKAKKVTSLKFKTVGSKLTIEKKESKKLRVTRLPSNATNMKIKWTSSNPSIVTVANNGVVKGKKKGTATITARTTDGSNLKIKCKVTVGKKVKSLKLTNSNKLSTLKVGTTFKLKTSVSPSSASNTKLSWSSSKPSVASVSSSGKITALKNGTAKITATSTDGTNRKRTCKVTVVTPISSIKISSVSGNILTQKGATLALIPYILPYTATKTKLNWSTSNKNIATVNSSGTVTAIASGSTIITVVTTDGSLKSSTFKITVDCLDSNTTKLVAHRGYSSMAPENSLSAFQLACQNNFWGVELDIWETSDEEFVVSHDNSLSAMCGINKNVTDITLAEATSYTMIKGSNVSTYSKEKIPSLSQALNLLALYPNVHPIIEIKDNLNQESLSRLLEMIKQYHMMDRVSIISFNANNLTNIRSLTPLGGNDISLQLLKTKPTESTVDFCIQNRIDLNSNYKYLNPSYVSTLHANGRKVIVYTINNYAAAYDIVKSMGVDVITSDYKLF